MPEPGDVHLERLKNGTFVWVVRHFSGDVTVPNVCGTCDAYSELPGIRKSQASFTGIHELEQAGSEIVHRRGSGDRTGGDKSGQPWTFWVKNWSS